MYRNLNGLKLSLFIPIQNLLEINKFNVKYDVMVNSGSSANLLATFAACNPARKNRFHKSDEVIIPSLCWPTSLWPLVQAGLKPKFVDVDYKTLNVRAKDIINSISKKTKVILLIHVLGNSTDIDLIRKVAQKKKIILQPAIIFQCPINYLIYSFIYTYFWFPTNFFH